MGKMLKLAVSVVVTVFSVLAVQPVSAGFMDGLKNVTSKATSLVQKEDVAPAPVTASTTDSSCKTAQAAATILNKKEFYAGYSKDFQEYKADMEKGKVDKAFTAREEYIAKKKKDPNVLFAWEQSLMALDANKREDAIKYLDLSEKLLETRADSSVTADAGKKALTEVVKFVGFDEFGEYEGEPFERILMLNYKSIAYMLNGDRKAYNVTRRAIDWQNSEKKEFDKKMAKAEKDLQLEEKKQEQAQAPAQAQNKSPNDSVADFKNVLKPIADIFNGSKDKAQEVPSAFVNPFGFYMAGIVQEYDSYQDASLRDNAKISYQKALQLNPKSKVIQQALQEIKGKAPKDKRLIQIVVADGFAPEKKVVSFDLPFSGSTIPLKVPIYIEDKSKVDKIEVQDCKGKCLAKLSQVADIDAITMRHQQDSLPTQRLRLAITVGRSIAENKVAQSAGFIGLIGKKIRDDNTNPDMRSWMGLPKQILAARLLLPKGVDGLQLVKYNADGKVLGREKLKLRKNDHNFVYARSIDDVMYINSGNKMWVTM